MATRQARLVSVALRDRSGASAGSRRSRAAAKTDGTSPLLANFTASEGGPPLAEGLEDVVGPEMVAGRQGHAEGSAQVTP